MINLAYMGFRPYGGRFAVDGSGYFPSLFFIKGLLTIGLFALIIYAIIKLVDNRSAVARQPDVSEAAAMTGSDALKLLDERYVRGELTDEEYRRIKQNLLSLPKREGS